MAVSVSGLSGVHLSPLKWGGLEYHSGCGFGCTLDGASQVKLSRKLVIIRSEKCSPFSGGEGSLGPLPRRYWSRLEAIGASAHGSQAPKPDKRPARKSRKPVADDEEEGKVASVELEGQGKVVTLSYGQVGTVGQQGQSKGQPVDAATETAQQVTKASQKAGDAVQEVGQQGALAAEELEQSARRVAQMAQESADEARDDMESLGRQANAALDGAGQEIRKDVREAGEAVQEQGQQAVAGAQRGAATFAKRTEAARARVEAGGEAAASTIQAAADRVGVEAEAAAAGVSGALIQAVGESVQAVGGFGEVLGDAAGVVLSELSGQAQEAAESVAPGVAAGGDEEDDPADPNASYSSAEVSRRGAELAAATTTSNEEAAQSVSAFDDYGPSSLADTPTFSAGNVRGGQKQKQGSKQPEEEEEEEEEEGTFKGMKAFVAGAGGRTGRALVRNAAKERHLWQIPGVEVVEGDVYKYETLQRSIGDSNVVLCAVGIKPDPLDPLGPYKEYEGVKNLVAVTKNQGSVRKLVLVTSLGVSQLLSPFNVFWGLLFWKRQEELEVQRSGLDYTIVRPGGLKSTESRGANVVMKPADSLFGGSIMRSQVADVCVEALIVSSASNKVVEVVAEESAAKRPVGDLFGLV
eukprot:jgi/Mesen1/8335/ME000046S07722